MGIMNTFPGAGDSLNKCLEEKSSSDFSQTIVPVLNISKQPSFYRYTTQDGVTLITSESDYKGMWAWDNIRGLRQIATADSGIYGSLSGGDVEGGAIFAVSDSSYASIYYYESVADTVTPIVSNRTRTTEIDGITPTYEGDGYWVILSYSYYNSSGTNFYSSTLEHISWPSKTFISKADWDTVARNKMLAAVPRGCLVQRRQSRSDSDAWVGAFDCSGDTATYISSSRWVGSDYGWSFVKAANSKYYVTNSSSICSLYIYDSTSHTWGDIISRGVGSHLEELVELPGKTVFISRALCIVDWQNGTSETIWTHAADVTLLYHKIDDDNYLFWTGSENYKGVWHYTISAGSVEQIDSTLWSLAQSMMWNNGLLFTKGALAYYDITAGTLTVYDADCQTTAVANKRTILTAGHGYIKRYDLDNNLALLQTSPQLPYYLDAIAVYGDTVLVATSTRDIYVYSINKNVVCYLDSCASNVSGESSYGKDGKLFVPYMYGYNGTDWYMYDARTMTKVKVDWKTVCNSI